MHCHAVGDASQPQDQLLPAVFAVGTDLVLLTLGMLTEQRTEDLEEVRRGGGRREEGGGEEGGAREGRREEGRGERKRGGERRGGGEEGRREGEKRRKYNSRRIRSGGSSTDQGMGQDLCSVLGGERHLLVLLS